MDGENAGTEPGDPASPWRKLPLVAAGRGFVLLEGVRVVDLTTSVAGPYATMLLSDFGAEVIKVERHDGDDARQWGPPFLDGQALWFSAVNRNKKSVTLDLRRAEGVADLRLLIESADVVVLNQPPDVQRKLGLDYDSLRALNDGLVYVAITGFGLDGARAGLTCYDLIAEGYSGIMDITGMPDSPPQKIGAPAADMLAGQDAAMAALAALFARHRSGRGSKIDISLVESMTRFLTCRISSYLGSGEVPVRSGGTDSVIAIYQSFETADEPLNLGLGSEPIWRRFWAALDDKEFGARPEFGNNAARREHRAEIVARIQGHLIRRTRSEWLELFAATRIPAGPINRVDQVVHDPDLQNRGLFFALRDGARISPQVGLGIRIDDRFALPRSAPPELGQHNQEVHALIKGLRAARKAKEERKDG